jgi:hypothetical protein
MNPFTQNEQEEPCRNGREKGRLGVIITALKERLRADYEARFPTQKRLVREILDEAETVAWLTPFPHLFLPDLVEAGVGQRVPKSPGAGSVNRSQAQAA